jgi:predicted short-subunit dehydrogenase-like oxidoreductase (DUF2520 family)
MNKKNVKHKVGFIGAGKIAYSLVPAVIKAGCKVVAISSTSLLSAKQLAVKNKITCFTDNAGGLVEKCDMIFLSVPDSQIDIVAKEISMLPGLEGKLFIHLSGTRNINSLLPLKKKGADIAGLHLLQTFPERKSTNIAGSYASVESDKKETVVMLKSLAAKIGAIPFTISSDEKVLLHIMCVFTSNFVNADYYNASLLYNKIKSKLPPVEKLLYPLSNENLKNIHKNGFQKALSGPIARKDFDSVERHLETLAGLCKKDKNIENVLETYAAQTMNILYMIKDNKKNPVKTKLKK